MEGKKKKWVIGLIIAFIVIGTIILLNKDRLSSLNIGYISSYLRSLGPIAVLFGGGLIILQTFFPFIPFIVLAGANVLVFGLWGGFLINWISATTASIAMFYIARTIGRDWAQKQIKGKPKIDQFNQFIQRNGFRTIFIFHHGRVFRCQWLYIGMLAACTALHKKV